jgi:hypothetical protein
MSGSGKGGNNRRRPFKRREREHDPWQDASSGGIKRRGDKPRPEKGQGAGFERPRWTPVKISSEPLPVPDCPWCGKPIKDITMAITDKNTGQAVHFDCIIAKIAEMERPEGGDVVTYIGGGRFGIVRFQNPQDPKSFSIKKILEWEDKENRAEWRKNIADHFSVT